MNCPFFYISKPDQANNISKPDHEVDGLDKTSIKQFLNVMFDPYLELWPEVPPSLLHKLVFLI